MRRQIPGGVSPFPVQTRPSIFNPLPPEEMIERHGEPALWLRQIPTADVSTQKLTLPDAKADAKGMYHAFQKTRRIRQETITVQGIRDGHIYPAWTPIDRVHRLYVHRDDIQGGPFDLNVISFDADRIHVEFPPEWKYWHQMFLDYEMRTYETVEFVYQKGEVYGNVIRPIDYPEVFVKVHELWRQVQGNQFVQMTDFSASFSEIRLPLAVDRGVCFRVKADVYTTIPVGYRTMNVRSVFTAERAGLNIKEGDLEAVISPEFYIADGDILIFAQSKNVGKEIAVNKNGLYRLRNSPIEELISVHNANGDELSPDDFILEGFQHFRLRQTVMQPEKLSVSYHYHPAYRVVDKLEFSALNNREQPRKWLLRPDFSNSIL